MKKKEKIVFWMGIEEKNPPHFTCYVPISSGAGRIDDESNKNYYFLSV